MKLKFIYIIMNRTDIINLLIEKYKYKSYLEIGLDNPYNNYCNINCELKHSVDPYFEKDHQGTDAPIEEEFFKYLTYRMTSDEFFASSDMKYDIIFIDGLHCEDQVGKDIINGLKHLNKNGKIVVHDCLPNSEIAQIVPRQTGEWNGDVWKAITMLHTQNIHYDIVDTDYGCGVISWHDNPEGLKYLEHSPYVWSDYEKDRNRILNIISIKEFQEKYL